MRRIPYSAFTYFLSTFREAERIDREELLFFRKPGDAREIRFFRMILHDYRDFVVVPPVVFIQY